MVRTKPDDMGRMESKIMSSYPKPYKKYIKTIAICCFYNYKIYEVGDSGSTWTVVATKIITDITGIKGAVGTSSASSNGKYFVAQTSSFGQATEPAVGGYNMNVSTDQTIPGASVTNSSITVNVWRRTA